MFLLFSAFAQKSLSVLLPVSFVMRLCVTTESTSETLRNFHFFFNIKIHLYVRITKMWLIRTSSPSTGNACLILSVCVCYYIQQTPIQYKNHWKLAYVVINSCLIGPSAFVIYFLFHFIRKINTIHSLSLYCDLVWSFTILWILVDWLISSKIKKWTKYSHQ